MAEIITEPESPHVVHHYTDDDSSGSWVAIVGIAFLVVVALLFFYFAMPLLSRSTSPQITVPDKVDVNLNQGN